MGTNSRAAAHRQYRTSLDDSVFVEHADHPDVALDIPPRWHAAIPEEYADKAVSAVLIMPGDALPAQQVASEISPKQIESKKPRYVYLGITATTNNLNVIIRHA